MQSWKMPVVLVDAVKTHCAPTGDEPLPYLLHLGAVASSQICGALPGETTYWANYEEVLLALEMDSEMMQSCVREVGTMFDRVKRAISM
jgi:hypothetical protein